MLYYYSYGFGIEIISTLVSLVVNIFIIYWVYQDAKGRGMDAGVWALIACCTGCIGCCIYLIVRQDGTSSTVNYGQTPSQGYRQNLSRPYLDPSSQPTKYCQKCGEILDLVSLKCPKCDTLPTGKFCSQCGNPLDPDEEFCRSCGNKN